MSKIEELKAKANKASKESDKYWAAIGREQRRIEKRYAGRFVMTTYPDKTSVNHEITDEGYNELSRHKLYYDENRDELWGKDTISYSPKNYACGICGDQPLSNISLGFAPRYAACAKHSEFLFLMPNIFKIRKTKSAPPVSNVGGDK